MRTLRAVFFCAAFLSLFGCARDRDLELLQPFQPVYAPLPPEFLTGPIGRHLARQPAFAARVEAIGEPTAPPHGMKGQLYGADHILVFAPDPDPETHKDAPEEIFTFIWNTSAGSGYVLSEALQGYAPVTFSSLAATNSGSGGNLQVLHTEKPGDFPVQLATTNITVKLSRVRLGQPAADLMSPPPGFTRYSSAELMAQEIALRRHNLKREIE
jgi:hypothetical protein